MYLIPDDFSPERLKGKTIEQVCYSINQLGLFWENGNILEEGSYKNWKKDGKWVKYRENGEVDVTTIYKNGRLIEQIWG